MIGLGYQIAAGLALTGIATIGGYAKGHGDASASKDAEIASIELARTIAISDWQSEQEEAARLRTEAWETARAFQIQRDHLMKKLSLHQAREVIVYEQTDPNATNCGLSCGGVRVWNTGASGNGRVPEAPATAACRSSGAEEGLIAALNAQVVTAANQSFMDHWACIDYSNDLYAWVETFCQGAKDEEPE